MARGATSQGKLRPFTEWLDDWAFARVELKLTDQDFHELTTPQWDALLRAWKDAKARDYAVQNATALNARWGSQKNLFPFKASMFLPESEETKQLRLKQEEQIRIAKQRALHLFMQQWSNELKSKSNSKPGQQG